MRQTVLALVVVPIFAALVGVVPIKTRASSDDVAQTIGPLRLVQTIALPGVKGRIDHMAIDIDGQRLFIAALGSDTLEIVDLRSGKRILSIIGLHEPQDVSYVAESGRILVSNGADGALSFFDSRSLRPAGKIDLHEDADNLRYDARSKYLYVGYGGGALGIVDAKSEKIIGDIRLAGHPEAFQLESTGPRIFVNIPSVKQVAVLDRNKRSVISVWPLEAAGNFAMALDEKRHRLFIGCRHPAKILIHDTESGKKVSSVNIRGDVDDIYYDEVHRQLYASCGEGFLYVIRQTDANHYEVTEKIKTAPGARTARFVPEQMLLYLAVSGMAGKSAEIRVYSFVAK